MNIQLPIFENDSPFVYCTVDRMKMCCSMGAHGKCIQRKIEWSIRTIITDVGSCHAET